jgi:predicted GNAT family acetyltransferase
LSSLQEKVVVEYDCFWDGRYGLATAFVDGNEIGVLLFEDRDGEISINSIHVEADYRRQGIATGMAKAAFDEASPQVKRSNGGELPSIFASLLTDSGKSIAVSETLSEAIPELKVELRDSTSS